MAPIDLDPRRPRYPVVPVVAGSAIRHLPSGTTGVVEKMANDHVKVRDGFGHVHTFVRAAGEFSVDGVRCEPVFGRTAQVGAPTAPAVRGRSASGSVVVDHDARVAKASRILVEGVHDAELIEQVWGDDLRYCGIVVERLDGMDDLAAVVADFRPGPRRRLGVLLDHLVEGSKESRVAATIDDPNVLITGHPYVDVWEAIRPSVAGIARWPEVPMGEPWKEGVLERLGHGEMHPGEFWKRLLGRVTSYADLFPPLVGAVEQLIDFVEVAD